MNQALHEALDTRAGAVKDWLIWHTRPDGRSHIDEFRGSAAAARRACHEDYPDALSVHLTLALGFEFLEKP